MKKLLLFVFLFGSLAASAQVRPKVYLSGSTINNTVIARGGIRGDSVMTIPFRDTLYTPERKGDLVVRPQDGLMYVWLGQWFVFQNVVKNIYLTQGLHAVNDSTAALGGTFSTDDTISLSANNSMLWDSTVHFRIRGSNTMALDVSTIFEVQSTVRGVLFSKMNTGQMNAISSPTAGLEVYNTDSLDYCVYSGTGWLRASSIYTKDGFLYGNRSVSGNNNFLSLGTSASPTSFIALYSNGIVGLYGVPTLSAFPVITDANYVAAANQATFKLPVITANRTFTPPPSGGNKMIYIWNGNNAAFTWSPAAGSVFKDATGATLANFAGNTFYVFMNDGTNWIQVGAATQTPLGNVGGGILIAVPGTQNVKSIFTTGYIKADSVTNANGITFYADTTQLITVTALNAFEPALTTGRVGIGVAGKLSSSPNLLFDNVNNILSSITAGTGNTVLPAFNAKNTTAATSGNQQYGGAYYSDGADFNSGTHVSQPISIRWYNQTGFSSGTGNQLGKLIFEISYNGGSYQNLATLASTSLNPSQSTFNIGTISTTCATCSNTISGPLTAASSESVLGTSTLNASLSYHTVNISSGPYTIAATDHFVNITGGTFTITLPDCTLNQGFEYNFTNIGSGVITISTVSSQSIFANGFTGTTTYTLNPGSNVTLVSETGGGGWIATNSYLKSTFVSTAISYSVQPTDVTVQCTVGNLIITLPSPTGANIGRILYIKNTSAGNQNLSGMASGEFNLMAPSGTLGASVTLTSDGTGWRVLSEGD